MDDGIIDRSDKFPTTRISSLMGADLVVFGNRSKRYGGS
jgi:hypothetical protein